MYAPEPTDTIPAIATELSQLKTMPIDEFINTVVNRMVHFTISLTIALVVFYLGKFIIRKLYDLVAGILLRRSVDRSLSTFVLSLVRIVLYFILIVTVIGILGINTSSFIAIFASAGVAIGMALSGTLQNFAGGVLILLLKPYKVGDYIEAQGFAGTVTEIQIFSTIICTPDNKSIIIPNGGLSTGSINNWSREDYRRVDWTIAISYGDNVDTARTAILAMLASDPRIVQTTLADDRQERLEQAQEQNTPAHATTTPQKHGWLWRLFHRSRKHIATPLEQLRQNSQLPTHHHIDSATANRDRRPIVYLKSLDDSAVTLSIRAWVRTPDYWTVYYHYNEQFYNQLPHHGINFPFPQMDVHISQ